MDPVLLDYGIYQWTVSYTTHENEDWKILIPLVRFYCTLASIDLFNQKN